MVTAEISSWDHIARLDSNLAHHPDVQWYLQPALSWLAENGGRSHPLCGVIDPSFSQPPASTSEIRRIVLEEGQPLIIKELLADGPYYAKTATARALTLAGEQAIGSRINPGTLEELPFYMGIYTLTENGHGECELRPFALGDNGRVVSLMQEVDVRNTLALRFDLPDAHLTMIYQELVRRALAVGYELPPHLRERYASLAYIHERINEQTPGKLAQGVFGLDFKHLQEQAQVYVALANQVLSEDTVLVEYLESEQYMRRGGDFRAANVVLKADNTIAVVLDQINLLWSPDKWNVPRVTPAPWGMNSPLYEVAFLLPDLVAQDKPNVIQAVVDAYAAHDPNFAGAHWDDLSHVGVRALHFWTAMKCVEMAGFSTFDINNSRMSSAGHDYLLNVINTYAHHGDRMIEALHDFPG